MAILFEPLCIRNITLKNRIAVSPMCEYSSEDGFANDWHLVHLGGRAVGGAGLVLAEATAVSPEGRISPGDLGIWKDEHIVMLKRITEFIISQGAVPGVQLAHAGRKASHAEPWNGGKALTSQQGAWQTLAPSALSFTPDEPAPKEMSNADIQQFITDFTMAAKRSLEAGFQVIEIHAAHGYLLNEFLSPLSNHRFDEYGGSFENRCRLLLEITRAARAVLGDGLPLLVRISATDWVEGGFTPEDAVRLCLLLKENGADLIDCSSGGNSPAQKISVGPLYQVPFAEKIRKEAGILTGAVGLITNAKEAEQILTDGKADLVLLARQLLRDPYFPLHAAKELGADVPWPVQYERAKR
jgi:2,4-dienoyl-CoA reductase-like NADH-dependent reductase (Old Yellow Enzyme family)